MKLPNGYGSVTKMKGNRRNPWAVKITKGYHIDPETGDMKTKQVYLGYAKSKAEGLKMLAEYHNMPYVQNHDLYGI